MANRHLLNYRTVATLSTILLAGFTFLAARSLMALSQERLHGTLGTESGRLEAAYEASANETRHQMVALASVIASDPQIVETMSRAVSAVSEESGGSGGVRSAKIRKELLDRISGRWEHLSGNRHVQLMHFVLPGGTSFLRVNDPTLFGDSIAPFRPMIRDVETTGLPQSGFEAGRTFSGIRGVVPIFSNASGSGNVFVGMLEIGVSPESQLAFLSKESAAGFAMLLDSDTVRRAGIQPDSHSAESAEHEHDRYVLAASSSDIELWMGAGVLPEYADHFGTGFFNWGEKTVQVTRFPLLDYRTESEREGHPAWSVVFWRDVTAHFANLRAERWEIALRASVVFVLSLVILFLLVGYSTREWRRRVQERTNEVSALSERNRAMLMAVGEGMYGVDLRGNATFVNPSALSMLGFSEDEVVGKPQHALFHHHREDGGAYPDSACPVFHTVQDGMPRRTEDWFIRKDGSGFPVLLTVEPVRMEGVQTGAVVVFRDITELRRKEESLIRLATTDPLTGSLNRRAFLEKASEEADRSYRLGHPSSLLMADIDHFKAVNDGFGHAAGDDVIRRFVEIAKSTFRKIDTVGRVGGEEFAILLPETTLDQALVAAERFRSAVAKSPIGTVAGPVSVTVSVGAAPLEHGSGVAWSLRNADSALYRAKRSGRNRVESGSDSES